LQRKFEKISDPPLHFGKHGDPKEKYIDESDIFGKKGWAIFMIFLRTNSETALEFIEEEPWKYSKMAYFQYIERFFHLQMNQLSPNTIEKVRAIGPEIANDGFIAYSMIVNKINDLIKKTKRE